MRTQLSNLALTAAFGLALVFTFSCSSNDSGEQSYNYCVMADNACLVGPFTASTCSSQLSNSCPDGSTPIVGGSSSSGGGGKGVPFNPNSQIYNNYCDYFFDDDDDNDTITCYTGDAYTGSGDIILDNFFGYPLIVGRVTNGIVHLELPTIPDEHLGDFLGFLEDDDEKKSEVNCTDYPNGIKYNAAEKMRLVLVNSGSADEIGSLYIRVVDYKYPNDIENMIEYWYFSKAGKITCKRTIHYDDGDDRVGKYNLDVKAGWNIIYYVYNRKTRMSETSTNNILTKPMKWLIYQK
ncbi:MAG: hypothetical protein LBC87_06120 [Fibromonadaceae bacterium]|jgi:hypothetical protein|nr:hypothetical protein [Fibromonadaceae bacterium]